MGGQPGGRPGGQRSRGRRFVVGVDYGTLSGRAVVVDCADGAELGSAVHAYTHGVMDRMLAATGATLPPDWALQVPADYLDVLRTAVPAAVRASGVDVADVVGIGIDVTAGTVLPVLADGTPLCELPEYADRPHAYVKLWKHHAAQPHADRLTEVARARGERWLPRFGGRVSSEWEFAKGLELLEQDPEVYARTRHWIEAADWLVWQLSGTYLRNACTAGYKALRQDGAYPDEDYLAALHPGFAGFVRDKVEQPIGDLGARAGSLTAGAAAWTGLPAGIAVAVGNADAHVTGPAAASIDPGQMVVVMGTSSCHVMNADRLEQVPGMCGVVDGGIVPGLWGYEAGQSGVGDVLGWFVETSVPPELHAAAAARGVSLHTHLSDLSRDQPVGAHGLLALDWHGGNRSLLVDHELSGVILGLTLATRPEEVYRALVEATAFGSRTIIEGFERSGLPVTELVVAGGLVKNEFLMQVYADVTRRPISVLESEYGPALGSAIHAAVAAGVHADVRAASRAMGRARRAAYLPDPARADAYDLLHAEYTELHDYFGRGGNDVLHRLRRRRRAALGG